MRRRTNPTQRMNPTIRRQRQAAASGAREATAVKLSNFGYQYSTPALFSEGATPTEPDQNWQDVWSDFEKRQFDVHSLIHCMASNGSTFPDTKVCEIMTYYKVLYAVMETLRDKKKSVPSVGAAEFKQGETTNTIQNFFFVNEDFVRIVAMPNNAANRPLQRKLLSLYRFVKLLHDKCQSLANPSTPEVSRFKNLSLSQQSLRSTNEDGRIHRNLLIASQLFFQYLTFYRFAFDESFRLPWFDESQSQSTVKLLPLQSLSSFMNFSGLAMKGMHTLNIDTWRTHLVLLNEDSNYENTFSERTLSVVRNTNFNPNFNQFVCISTRTTQKIAKVELPRTYSFPLHFLSTSMFLIVKNSQTESRNDRFLDSYAVPPSDDSNDRSNRNTKLLAWRNQLSPTSSERNHNIELLVLGKSIEPSLVQQNT